MGHIVHVTLETVNAKGGPLETREASGVGIAVVVMRSEVSLDWTTRRGVYPLPCSYSGVQ